MIFLIVSITVKAIEAFNIVQARIFIPLFTVMDLTGALGKIKRME